VTSTSLSLLRSPAGLAHNTGSRRRARAPGLSWKQLLPAAGRLEELPPASNADHYVAVTNRGPKANANRCMYGLFTGRIPAGCQPEPHVRRMSVRCHAGRRNVTLPPGN